MTSDSVGDVLPYALALAGSLADLDIHVGLATFGPFLSLAEKRRIERQSGLELFESGLSAEWMPGFWSDEQRAADWLLRLAAEFQPDLVHLNGLLFSSLPWSSPVLVVEHRCMASWWLDLKGQPLPRQWNIYRDQVARGLSSVGLVVAGSNVALATLREHYGPFSAGRVIPYGWHLPEVTEEKRGFIITAQRLWDHSSNLEVLERCAPYLAWPVFCAGDSLDSSGIRVKAQARNVCCLGGLSEEGLEEWLRRSSIYVVPARDAHCQVSVLQAAMAGCALVLGNHPALKEVWDQAAVFVPPEDPEALRCALDRLICDRERRDDLADKAQRRARGSSIAVMTGQYCLAYQEVLLSGTRSSGVLSHAVGA